MNELLKSLYDNYYEELPLKQMKAEVDCCHKLLIELKYGSKGTPAVRIHLEVPANMNAHPFWPWRESEIANLFNSCPPGDYYMEAWDVYIDGVFQRTEYNIKAI